jgi:NAD(P)-dependent dehydrogenase (short-subunit alcohol dehydrogenase family)
VKALARVMAADLADTPVTANILLPGATATGMIPDEMRDELRANLLDPAIMGPPIVWLASPDAAGEASRSPKRFFTTAAPGQRALGRSSRISPPRAATRLPSSPMPIAR